jgi:hypothetical protein
LLYEARYLRKSEDSCMRFGYVRHINKIHHKSSEKLD